MGAALPRNRELHPAPPRNSATCRTKRLSCGIPNCMLHDAASAAGPWVQPHSKVTCEVDAEHHRVAKKVHMGISLAGGGGGRGGVNFQIA